MIRVGVIGLGVMGLTHLDVYSRRSDARVVAIADRNPQRLAGRLRPAGNIEGQAQGGFDTSSVRTYLDESQLIADAEVDLVDICVPTPAHFEVASAALRSGKHVLIEKPLARTAADADKLVELADRSKGLSMCAMCMRFWPGWSWLKDVIDRRMYGRILSATFRRLSSHPGRGAYLSGELGGGAILDLHIHDADFIHFLFGIPRSVSSRGYSKVTTAIDHVVTQYDYEGIPLVMAEGSWAMAPGIGFNMQYMVNFESATAAFDLAQQPNLTLAQAGTIEPVEIPAGMGYDHEIAYFLDCIREGRKPQIVTLKDAANSIRIIEAEGKSIEAGGPVAVAWGTGGGQGTSTDP